MDQVKEIFLQTQAKKLTSFDVLEKAHQLRQGPSETVTAYIRRFRKFLFYLRKEIETPLIIERMINSLQINLITAYAASNCRNMSWGRVVAYLEALKRQLSKFTKLFLPWCQPK